MIQRIAQFNEDVKRNYIQLLVANNIKTRIVHRSQVSALIRFKRDTAGTWIHRKRY